ncbi:MAG TPA: hypothetical protein VN962_28345 [Polyangia bacterium]|nr:hypothetical protein [Polyangia bacterium]
MRVKWIALLAAGAALGGLGATWWSSSHAAVRRAAVAPEDRAALEDIRTRTQVLAAVQAAANLQARPAGDPAPSTKVEEPVVVVPPARRPTAEEMEREAAAAQAAQALRIEQHRAERRDDAWASTMETTIDTAIRGSANAGLGKYEGAECRSQTCLVSFSWASLEEARSDIRAMMGRTVSLPCATSLVLPADDGTAGRIKAPVYLDCATERHADLSASR